MFVVFFFKQKTAYEMRISDWSSDVCSSDLAGDLHVGGAELVGHQVEHVCDQAVDLDRPPVGRPLARHGEKGLHDLGAAVGGDAHLHCAFCDLAVAGNALQQGRLADHRSEEHTSELQSLMRISYAVFCL